MYPINYYSPPFFLIVLNTEQKQGDYKWNNDNMIVDTEKAVQSWNEGTYFNGSNNIGTITGSQWNHEKLYKTRTGKYWIESESCTQLEGSKDHAEFISKERAAQWLLLCDYELPEDLKSLEETILH